MARRQINVDKYVQVSEALRKAYDDVKMGNIVRSNELREMFKPVTKPLQEIKNRLSPQSVLKEEIELRRMGEIGLKYIHMYTSRDVKTDPTFGLYAHKGSLYIGNQPVVILENNIHFSDGETFQGTDGLWQLICLRNPNNYTHDDYDNYTKIVLKSHTYRHNNDPNAKQVKSSNGYKYINIIKPILLANGIIRTKVKQGTGLQKIVTNKPVEYVYWNTLEELLEKLYILYGEIRSGNKNPSLYNEISSILEEIREI